MAIDRSNPYAPPSDHADGSPVRGPDLAVSDEVAAIVVELSGRLAAADLTILFRVNEELQVRPAFRQVLAWLLAGVLLATVGGMSVSEKPVDLGAVAVCAVLFILLADLVALRHIRYRIAARRQERQVREHVARFDQHGLVLAPVEQLDASNSFDWPSLDVLSLREGIIITLRRGTRAICFVPVRELTNEQTHHVEMLARALGGRVLDRPHGSPLT